MKIARANKVLKSGPVTRNNTKPNFSFPIEMALYVPIVNPRFILGSSAFTCAMNQGPGVNEIIVNEMVPNEVPAIDLYDFNGAIIQNAVFGPSSAELSRGAFEIFNARYASSNSIYCDKDLSGDPAVLSIDLSENDNVYVLTKPSEIVETSTMPDGNSNLNLDNQISSKFGLRKPKMINVQDHSNTLFGNLESGNVSYLSFPITKRFSIFPKSAYRFSFYYRASGEGSFHLYEQFFTNGGTLIETRKRKSISFNQSLSEDSDFEFFEAVIPDGYNGRAIPNNCRRIRFFLKFEPVTDIKMEIAYPICEHSFDSAISTSVMISDVPSDLSYELQHSSVLSVDDSGKIISEDSTKLFFNQTGRNLFEMDIGWDVLDSNYISAMRVIENFNEKGIPVVLRPQHYELPPVLIGNISLSNNAQSFDYQDNLTRLNFQEIQ